MEIKSLDRDSTWEISRERASRSPESILSTRERAEDTRIAYLNLRDELNTNEKIDLTATLGL